MGHAPEEDLDCSRVQTFRASRFDSASCQVAHVGAGAWSRCRPPVGRHVAATCATSEPVKASERVIAGR
jgi:hypothetical protein